MRRYLSGVAFLALAAHANAADAEDRSIALEPNRTDGSGAHTRTIAAPCQLPSETPVRMSLPLVHDNQIHGDVLVDLYIDGQIRYYRDSLIEQLAPLLTDEAQAEFAFRLGADTRISAEQIEFAGVRLRYDPSLLEIQVEWIDPALRRVQSLGAGIGRGGPPITLEPESFSAYLNIIGDFHLADTYELQEPAMLLTGAIRQNNFVFEFDGGYDRQLAPDSGLYRRAARLVYDQPERQRRWSAGDIEPISIGVIGGAILGGIGVEKGRRNFMGADLLTPIGGQQVLLERDATVEVVVDGQQVRTMQLSAGPYDLAELRAEFFGRNAQLFITDITGRRQLAEFDTYFNPTDLAKGETEYGAALGVVPQSFDVQPTYDGPPAFSGYYRRGITNRLSLGAALQASEDVQIFGGELVFASRAVPGRFELSAATSSGNGAGYAARAGYSLNFGPDGSDRQLSLSVDYRSAEFTTLIDQIGLPRAETFSAAAGYSQRLGARTSFVAGANLFEREGLPSSRNVYADVVHRTDRYRFTIGVEYGQGPFFDRQFGVRVAITAPFGRSTRGEVGYNSRRNEYRAYIARSSDDRIGAWDYSIGARGTPTNSTVDATGNYVSNRFYARGVVSGAGSGGSIDERQSARLQIGTSVAYAGGAAALGRPIADSFLIASPHDSLEDEQVVLGQSVQARRYDAASGALGPALYGRLTSYSRQSVVYDLAEGARGYDIGSGVETVQPSYRSGYRLVVGSGATVTAHGFLNLPDGPAELVGGSITSSDDAEFGTQPFFTNSVGRFAIGGLRPGKTYTVRLFDNGGTYTIMVPAESDSLLALGEILIEPTGDGQE